MGGWVGLRDNRDCHDVQRAAILVWLQRQGPDRPKKLLTGPGMFKFYSAQEKRGVSALGGQSAFDLTFSLITFVDRIHN